MLDALGQAGARQLLAEPRDGGPEVDQAPQVVTDDPVLAAEKAFVELGEAVEPPVGDTRRQQPIGDRYRLGLQVGVQSEDVDPAGRLARAGACRRPLGASSLERGRRRGGGGGFSADAGRGSRSRPARGRAQARRP